MVLVLTELRQRCKVKERKIEVDVNGVPYLKVTVREWKNIMWEYDHVWDSLADDVVVYLTAHKNRVVFDINKELSGGNVIMVWGNSLEYIGAFMDLVDILKFIKSPRMYPLVNDPSACWV